jgi:hypothetical protein
MLCRSRLVCLRTKSLGRIVHVMLCPRDASFKGRIVQGTHHPSDASSKGRIVQGTHRPRAASSKGRIVHGTHRPMVASSKGRIVQGKHRQCDRTSARLFVWGNIGREHFIMSLFGEVHFSRLPAIQHWHFWDCSKLQFLWRILVTSFQSAILRLLEARKGQVRPISSIRHFYTVLYK